jgi:hypothetical protein
VSVVHTTAIRTGLADLVVDAIDGGTSNGVLQFQTAAEAEVATLAFGSPAFGDAVSGVATADTIDPDADAVGGTIDHARLYTSDDGITPGTEILSCSVTATGGGGDIELNSVVVAAAQEVQLNSLTYAAPN